MRQDGSAAMDVDIWKEGTYEVRLCAVDRAGNRGETASQGTVFVDMTPPRLTMASIREVTDGGFQVIAGPGQPGRGGLFRDGRSGADTGETAEYVREAVTGGQAVFRYRSPAAVDGDGRRLGQRRKPDGIHLPVAVPGNAGRGPGNVLRPGGLRPDRRKCIKNLPWGKTKPAREVLHLQGKVEICGVNTSKLKVLDSETTRELLVKTRRGIKPPREELIAGNLRLVLSVIQRFTSRGENVDDLFQVGCIGLIKAIDNFNAEDTT